MHPTTVDTDRVRNQGSYRLFRPDLVPGTATIDDAAEAVPDVNLPPVRRVEPVDVSDAIIWLRPDMARYVARRPAACGRGVGDQVTAHHR